jgi:release factor glutamine methyltransferase
MQQRSVMRRLREVGVDNPGLEARMLTAAAGDDAKRLEALLSRRLAHEPMAFILGRRGFWTLDLEVSRDTLIPRPESETLVEAALAAFPDHFAVHRVLDLGTGTGCLLLAALVEFPAAWGIGIDIQPSVAALAARNARRNGLHDRARFLCADWAAPIRDRFDLLLCNPPYVKTGDIATLMPEVSSHEPRHALDGGTDGLAAYRRLIPIMPRLLTRGGVAIFELGQGQGAAVAEMAARNNLALALRHDLGGIARALVLRNGTE